VSDPAFEALKNISYFSGLPDTVIADLAKCAIQRHFDTGQVVYLEGEPAKSVFILEAGWIKATRVTLEGREQAMAFMRPGEIFGDVAVFSVH
jgi:CRP-like cAMP-binding protein